MKRKILLGLTTTPGSDWREKAKEVDRLNLEEIALFPTFLEINERKELYKLLENTRLKKIPHVHLRDDMEEWELDLFDKKYETEVYNIHPCQEDLNFLKKITNKKKCFVENCEIIDELFFEIANACGGICLDISHWEDECLKKGYDKFPDRINDFKIGCSHISAISSSVGEYEHYRTKEIFNYYSSHRLDKLSELDYVKKYVKYLPKYVSIELENSFQEQLKIKEYLEKIINI
jgi:hypothetical protein